MVLTRMARTKSTSKSSQKQSSPPPTWDEKLIKGLLPYRVELVGLLFFLVAILTLLTLLGFTRSPWLNWWTGLLVQVFGWGAYALSLILAAAGIHLMLRKVRRHYHIRPAQVVAIELILLPALALTYQLTSGTLLAAYEGRSGGLIGWALAQPMLEFLGPFLTTSFYLALMVWGIFLLVGLQWETVHRLLWRISHRSRNWASHIAPQKRKKCRLKKRHQLPR